MGAMGVWLESLLFLTLVFFVLVSVALASPWLAPEREGGKRQKLPTLSGALWVGPVDG